MTVACMAFYQNTPVLSILVAVTFPPPFPPLSTPSFHPLGMHPLGMHGFLPKYPSLVNFGGCHLSTLPLRQCRPNLSLADSTA